MKRTKASENEKTDQIADFAVAEKKVKTENTQFEIISADESIKKEVKNYAARLSFYANKGVCGLRETYDTKRSLKTKLNQLVKLVKEAKHLVAITGAGISTSSGIPDFRGPNGVWTKEKEAERKKLDLKGDNTVDPYKQMDPLCFEKAKPSPTHDILTQLHKDGILKFLVSQNVDGLHLRSGYPREAISELHGNLYTEKCEDCAKEFFGEHDVGGMGARPTGNNCTACGGVLRDTVLDWDTPLPEKDFESAQTHCEKSDLILCLGTSLRIVPVADMPLLASKFVVVNLQATPLDDDATLVIRAKVDNVMKSLIQNLNL
mmetsp:Transcript_12254/g.15883  ORF Transcript_12254/g.15883 Transcript_12254/m.15883 type:complete len:318 (-) Transcript_12254:1023-1976(-)|eukprot:CAMPEP_0184017168 /NCGR_PEP_ID=MMETSP0954-20121128/7362_1 /TAXON_ID=627963 /ORGANISM="Aplanochytrium sp, Strain PBS07" /LENGTH=317 /DNA_ID=CAMNT_0026298325 /DNA_START=150 /DNA_END=1103 /DNA_ORIENTATION=+